MAQIRTNILPRSCSQLILCVRAKGCGRAWKEGKKGEDEEWKEQGSPSSGGTRLILYMLNLQDGSWAIVEPHLLVLPEPSVGTQNFAVRTKHYVLTTPLPTCMVLFNHNHYQTLKGASHHHHSSVKPRPCTPLTDGKLRPKAMGKLGQVTSPPSTSVGLTENSVF